MNKRKVIDDRLKSKLKGMAEDETVQVIAAYTFKNSGNPQTIIDYFKSENVPILSHMKNLSMVCVDLTPSQIYGLAKKDYINIISENRKLGLTKLLQAYDEHLSA